MIDVVVVQRRNRLSSTWVKEQLALLAKEEQSRLLMYRRWQDQQSSLIGRVLAKTKLSQLLNVPRESLQISKDEHGRLYLENHPFWGGDFNLSHSSDLIACAITKNGRVGIDVEYIKYLDFDLARQFLNEDEIQYAKKKHDDMLISFLYKIWTLKEAYLKALGIGLLRDPRSFGFDMKLWSEGILKIRDDKSLFKEEMFFHTLVLHGGYQLALCTNAATPVNISTFINISNSTRQTSQVLTQFC